MKKNLKNNLGDDVIIESEVGPAVPAAVDLPFQTHHKQPPHPSHKILNSKQISQPKKTKTKEQISTTGNGTINYFSQKGSRENRLK